jgi:hypothetical protein
MIDGAVRAHAEFDDGDVVGPEAVLAAARRPVGG